MKPIIHSALIYLALALLLPFAALAAGVDTAAEAQAEVSQDPAAISHDEVAMTPLVATPKDPTVDHLSAWLDPPEWTTNEVTTSFGNCPGPPAPSCQCGLDPDEPGSEGCCYCNRCWKGYVLALCELEP